jgi:hypothetical protein
MELVAPSRSVHTRYALPGVRPVASTDTVKLGAVPVNLTEAVLALPLAVIGIPAAEVSQAVPRYAEELVPQPAAHVNVTDWLAAFRIATVDDAETPLTYAVAPEFPKASPDDRSTRRRRVSRLTQTW